MSDEGTMSKRKCTRCSVWLPIDHYRVRRNGEINKRCNLCSLKSRNYTKKKKGETNLEQITKSTSKIDERKKQRCTRCNVLLSLKEFKVKRNGEITKQCNKCLNWINSFNKKKREEKLLENHPECANNNRLCRYKECERCHFKSFASSSKAQYWSEKNIVKPRDVAICSGKKFWFKCDICDHDFEKRLSHITKMDSWCPYCSNRILCDKKDCSFCFDNSFESHYRSKWWSQKNKQSPRDVFKTSSNKFWFNCNVCNHEFYSSLGNVSKDTWCPYCSQITALCGSKNCGHCFKKSFASHKKAQFWSSKNTLQPEDVTKSSNKRFWFDCEVCQHDFLASLVNITQKQSWCPYCSHQKLCTDKDCSMCFTNSFASSPRSVSWSKNNFCSPREVFLSSGVKYLFICDKCKNEFETGLNHVIEGKWCPFCKNKTEEKLMRYLRQIYPQIRSQQRFVWCVNPATNKKLCYDFHILPHNILIELDGPQHSRQISNWESPEIIQERDNYKNQMALYNNFSVIRLLQEEVSAEANNWEECLSVAISYAMVEGPRLIDIHDGIVECIELIWELNFL